MYMGSRTITLWAEPAPPPSDSDHDSGTPPQTPTSPAFPWATPTAAATNPHNTPPPKPKILGHYLLHECNDNQRNTSIALSPLILTSLSPTNADPSPSPTHMNEILLPITNYPERHTFNSAPYNITIMNDTYYMSYRFYKF